jgi:hypothetical protein
VPPSEHGVNYLNDGVGAWLGAYDPR